MRLYKLAYTGPAGLGVSPVQVVTSGRVRSVFISAIITVPFAEVIGYGVIQVGIAAVTESGIVTASPVNFAVAAVSSQLLLAATNHSACINVEVPCDFPVQAGQNLQLNLASVGAGTNFENIEVTVNIG